MTLGIRCRFQEERFGLLRAKLFSLKWLGPLLQCAVSITGFIFVLTTSPRHKKTKALLEFGHMETLSRAQTHIRTNTTVDYRNDKVTPYWFKDTTNTDTHVHIYKQKACEQRLPVQLHHRLSINLTEYITKGQFELCKIQQHNVSKRLMILSLVQKRERKKINSHIYHCFLKCTVRYIWLLAILCKENWTPE